jgi:hypothetical protein
MCPVQTVTHVSGRSAQILSLDGLVHFPGEKVIGASARPIRVIARVLVIQRTAWRDRVAARLLTIRRFSIKVETQSQVPGSSRPRKPLLVRFSLP